MSRRGCKGHARTKTWCGAGAGSFRRGTSRVGRVAVSDDWVKWRLKDARWVARARPRLQSLNSFVALALPDEDRRRLDSSREGMVGGDLAGECLLLMEYAGRSFRAGKASLSREVAEILDRLGSSADHWQARLEKCATAVSWAASSRPAGSAQEVAEQLGVRRMPNLAGCPTT